MTDYAADPTLTLSAARDLYFAANHFGADGGYNDAWVDFKLGPIPMPFPNTPGRLRAVRPHDLHHVLAAYGTDTLGEFEISAWEIGGGCADHYAAWALNLSGAVAGMLTIPRRTWRAFLRGRRTRNLYRTPYNDALLARRVGEVRAELGLDRDEETARKARASDVALFGTYLAAGLVVGSVSAALVVPLAVGANVVALFRRRRAVDAGGT
jgi:hypothetical protein